VIDLVARYIAPMAYAVLPTEMASPPATALVLAIGWQESRFAHRVQVKGPARGFFQFEQGGGVSGVLSHPKSAAYARAALKALGYRYEPTPQGCYWALEHNDALAFAFARLLLYTLPWPLPVRTMEAEGWRQYVAAWRPGKPHLDTWGESWKRGWAAVG
jgi:hypothetical protein